MMTPTDGVRIRRTLPAIALAAGVLAWLPAAAAPEPGPKPAMAVAAAVWDALGEERDGVLGGFYAERLGEPLFMTAGGSPSATGAAVLDAGARAAEHALPAGRYAVPAIAPAEGASPAEIARTEIAVAQVYLRYARDVSSGLLEPRRVDRELHVYPERPEPAALLVRLAGAADPAATIAALAPQHPDYATLRRELADYQRLAKSDAWAEPLPEGPTLREGDRSARVEALRRRLIAMGDLDVPSDAASAARDGTEMARNDVTTDMPGSGGDPEAFTPVVADAVQRFQARHGLNRDGIVGPATRGALNASPAERARQIAVNLERLRWLNRDLGDRHVMVNLAGFEMALVEEGEPVFTSRVVIGKAYRHQTPEFSDEMEHMVVNPTWFVPASIAREEILPKLQADPGYLEQKNMRLVGADAEQIDWTQVTPSSFPGRVRQGPGPGNALGRVKFMFPNDFAIYLHDTPQRSLFRRDRRAYSHGCVRVAEPMQFAYHLLEPQAEDPQALVDRYVRSGNEIYLHLDEHVPVHITYRTAWVAEDGTDQFRGDIYGRDRRVFAALEEAGLALPGL